MGSFWSSFEQSPMGWVWLYPQLKCKPRGPNIIWIKSEVYLLQPPFRTELLSLFIHSLNPQASLKSWILYPNLCKPNICWLPTWEEDSLLSTSLMLLFASSMAHMRLSKAPNQNGQPKRDARHSKYTKNRGESKNKNRACTNGNNTVKSSSIP